MDEVLRTADEMGLEEFEEFDEFEESEMPKTTAIAEPENTKFGEAMETVKLNILQDASVHDEEFVKDVTDTAKSAALKNVKVEEKKADLEIQKVDYKSEVLSTEQERNAHLAAENKWDNKQKRRLYHYNGVKPIMTFVGINDPLNLVLLYALTVIIVPFFLVYKVVRGTIGAMIAGAVDQDRPKSVKGFLWTLIALFATLFVAAVVYLFLKWQGLINV